MLTVLSDVKKTIIPTTVGARWLVTQLVPNVNLLVTVYKVTQSVKLGYKPIEKGGT